MANVVPYVKALPGGQVRPLGATDVLTSATGSSALAADYVGRFEQATTPTTLQVPDTQWAYWYDTVATKLYIVRNRTGVIYSVETSNPTHAKLHGINNTADHSPGTNGTLVGTETGSLVEKAFSTTATASNIVQRDGVGDVIVPTTPGSSTAATSRSYVDAISVQTPRWYKVTKTFGNLSFAGLTNDIEVYSLAAGGVIHGVKIKHSTAFSGGVIASYTVSIGPTGNLVKYASAFDVFQATSNTTFQMSNSFGSEDHGAATSIRIAAISTGANLSAATTGSVDVWLLVSGAV